MGISPGFIGDAGDEVVLLLRDFIPRRLAFPDVGVRIVSMISTVVVLSAPFGPSKVKTSPFLTLNDMS